MVGKRIILKRELASGSDKPTGQAEPETTTQPADRTIAGQVTDEQGAALPGVNILLKGTQRGTTTNQDGQYSLSIPDGGESTLVFSFVGYEPQEVAVGNRSSLDLVLKPDLQALEEVVVVGYGTQKKSDLTGSVVRANIEAFRESPNVNLAQSLQGTVPGLNIGQTNQAGQNPSISIRGRTTINGNQNVLLVVDGIIFTGSMSDLNPADIASVDVLKDPSSMAIFGAQAANGVILITTKGGKQKASKPVFNYSGSYTTQNPSNTLHLFDRGRIYQEIGRYRLAEGLLGSRLHAAQPSLYVRRRGERPAAAGGLRERHRLRLVGQHDQSGLHHGAQPERERVEW